VRRLLHGSQAGLLRVQAGADWDTVVRRSIEAGLGGLETLAVLASPSWR